MNFAFLFQVSEDLLSVLVLEHLRVLIFIQQLFTVVFVFSGPAGISLPAIALEMVGHVDLWLFAVFVAVCSLGSLG